MFKKNQAIVLELGRLYHNFGGFGLRVSLGLLALPALCIVMRFISV